MKNMKKILLVEDDIDLRDSIESFLAISGFCVTSVGSGLEYYNELSNNDYTIAIIDIGLPDQSGIILAEYTRKNTSLKIIILTALNTLDNRICCYNKGADLFFAKPVDCNELVAAIKSLATRNDHKPSSISVSEPGRISWSLIFHGSQLITPEGTPLKLTYKEFQFLKLLSQSPGEPISRDVLLESIYPRVDQYTSQALDAMVKRLRAKISQTIDSTQPIVTAYGIGYAFSAPLECT